MKLVAKQLGLPGDSARAGLHKKSIQLVLLTIAVALVAGCSSNQPQPTVKPYWGVGPKPMTAVQAAEAYTYSNYHPGPVASSASTTPQGGRSQYEAFVGGGQR